jgi:LPS sulfotransferase NodH
MTRRPTRFVILATQRTGSSWVLQMLGSHPAVRRYAELFDPRGKDPLFFVQRARQNGTGRNPISQTRLCFSYLDEIYTPAHGLEAIGFKLMYEQPKSNPGVLAYIAWRRVRVIHLVRTNLLDILISGETARARGRFHSTGDDPPPVTVSLDPATVVARLDTLDRRVRLMRRGLAVTRTPTIEVRYEALAADPRGFGEILRFLDVDETGAELTASLRKLNKVERRQLVDNYDEIQDVLGPTRYAAFLD